VHQLVNKKNFDNIKMHGVYVKITKVRIIQVVNRYFRQAKISPSVCT